MTNARSHLLEQICSHPEVVVSLISIDLPNEPVFLLFDNTPQILVTNFCRRSIFHGGYSMNGSKDITYILNKDYCKDFINTVYSTKAKAEKDKNNTY